MKHRIEETDNRQVIIDVAALMGGTAELHDGEPRHMRRVRLSDGIAFDIADRYPYGRWQVSAWDWPEYTNKRGSKMRVTPREIGEESPCITASFSKTPEQIAKDIDRRFLPEYRRIYALCKAKAGTTQAYHDCCRAAYAYLMGAFGKDPTPSNYGDAYSGYIPTDTATYSTLADFVVHAPDSIEVKVRCSTPEHAREIIALRKKQLAVANDAS